MLKDPSSIAGRVAAGGGADVLGFVAMCVGMFMAILNVQVVATSLPTIQEALGIEPASMTWVQTVYLVAEVIAIPLTGVLTRALSMQWLFVAAVSLFTAASIGCATSTGFASLIAWRALQGFAGGTLIPSVFAAVFLLFPPRRQGIATTLAGVLAVLAPTVGPVVGGWITQIYAWCKKRELTRPKNHDSMTYARTLGSIIRTPRVRQTDWFQVLA